MLDGLKEFNIKSKGERIRRYRRFVYEAGAINRPDKVQAKVIDDRVVARERINEVEICRISRFRHRTRYFTDSGIIGSKEFVSTNYQRFKHLFYSKQQKKAKTDQGLGWDLFIEEVDGELIVLKSQKKLKIEVALRF